MPWINAEFIPNVKFGLFMVKTVNGNQKQAYFHHDQGGVWRQDYGYRLSYWYEKASGDAIYDVTHYRMIEPK